jgi:hypothetical protein
MEYDEFLLDVRHDGEIKATLTTCEGEIIGPIPGRLDLNDRLQEYVRDDIRRLQTGDLDGKPEQLERLGESLYETLFPGKIGDLFKQADEQVRKHRGKRRLRVWISVDCKDIADWPLEFLCAPGGLWLATSSHIALSRQLRFDTTRFQPAERDSLPLRVLAVVSKPQKPEDLGGVMSAKTIQEIAKWAAVKVGEKQAGNVKLLGIVEESRPMPGVEYLNRPATFENLGVWAREWSPHVLHFIGHGQISDGKPSLALVKDGGEADWCGPTEFKPLFADWRPRLVVLQACQSAMSTTGAGFMSLATHLVQQNIPAVVAMQFSIENDCATSFAAKFYENLAQGLDIDAAVQDGRWQISCQWRWTGRHFGTPVLFMLSPDGIIIEPQPAQERKLTMAEIPPLPSSKEEEAKEVLSMAARLVQMGRWDQAKSLSDSVFQPGAKDTAFESRLGQARQQLQAQGSPPKCATPGG